MKRFFLFAVLIVVSVLSAASAERPRILDARFEPDSVMIGDHFVLSIDIEKDVATPVQFPVFRKDFLEGRIELLEEYAPDTVSGNGTTQRLRKRYLMTSFDEAYYHIDSLGVLYADNNVIDTVFLDRQLELLVATMPVDTARTTIYDIKPTMKAPLLVDEVSGYVVWSVVGIASLLSIIYFWANRRRHKKTAEERKPKEAPHIVAIRALEHLNNQKLWQKSHFKQYYTGLTDILREYLDGRFGIGAREMTSDEILSALKKVELTAKQYSETEDVLRDADLVKFAKYIPDAECNEAAYFKIYYFVEETKQVEEVQAEKPEKLVEL